MWLKINTAPKDGTRVLLWEDDNVYAGKWEDDCWHSFCGQPVVYTPEPTHWQPEPLPPIDMEWTEEDFARSRPASEVLGKEAFDALMGKGGAR